jgi:hypothetical protein
MVSEARKNRSTLSGTVSSGAMASVVGALAMINSANQASEDAGSGAKDHGAAVQSAAILLSRADSLAAFIAAENQTRL